MTRRQLLIPSAGELAYDDVILSPLTCNIASTGGCEQHQPLATRGHRQLFHFLPWHRYVVWITSPQRAVVLLRTPTVGEKALQPHVDGALRSSRARVRQRTLELDIAQEVLAKPDKSSSFLELILKHIRVVVERDGERRL